MITFAVIAAAIALRSTCPFSQPDRCPSPDRGDSRRSTIPQVDCPMKNQKRFDELSVGKGFTMSNFGCVFIKISYSKTSYNALASTQNEAIRYRVDPEELVIPQDYTIVPNPNTH